MIPSGIRHIQVLLSQASEVTAWQSEEYLEVSAFILESLCRSLKSEMRTSFFVVLPPLSVTLFPFSGHYEGISQETDGVFLHAVVSGRNVMSSFPLQTKFLSNLGELFPSRALFPSTSWFSFYRHLLNLKVRFPLVCALFVPQIPLVLFHFSEYCFTDVT